MQKTLTISIAAYNVEKYIRETLDSLIDESVIDDLEIFVVDDGGSDHTLDIAKQYADKYPESIFLIHKENGGYGSTIQYSIEHASGKYFKLLDGDDWFNSEVLSDFVGILKANETDIIATPYFRCMPNEEPIKSKTVQNEILNKDLSISNMKIGKIFGMWTLTYKTELLQQCDMNLPLHCLYTDQIYSTIPFSVADTIRFEDYVLYCYRINQEEQSTSKQSRINHVADNIKTVNVLMDFYESHKLKNCKNMDYIFYRTSFLTKRIFRTFLLEPISERVIQNIKLYDQMLKDKCFDIYKIQEKISFNKKFALYMKVLRINHYGKISLLLGKLYFPKDGVKNWY